MMMMMMIIMIIVAVVVLHMNLLLAPVEVLPQLLLQELLLDLVLRHEGQVQERGRWYAHLFQLLLRVGLQG